MCLTLGCTANIDGGGAQPSGPGGSNGAVGRGGVGGLGQGPITEGGPLGSMPLNRLTRREYNNTLRDLLGDQSQPANAFPDDNDRTFIFRRAGAVAPQDASLLRAAAESAARNAIQRLDDLLPCTPDSGEDGCVAHFIDTFAGRAYRRPPTASEKARLTALYARGKGELGLDFRGGLGLLIEAMLQSPAFLYHWGSPEAAPLMEGGVARLDSYQVASRLAYFLLGTTPDGTLLAAAASGLNIPSEIEAQARRLIADPRARENVAAFIQELLDLDSLPELVRDPNLYPEYDEVLARALVEENRRFVEHVVFDDGGSLGRLLSADYSFVNQAVAGVYGLASSGTDFQKHTLNPSERGGLLTQPGFLALTGATDGSHPVRRGLAVYENFLCGTLPPPPNDVPPAAPATAGGTTRQRFDQHAQNPCAQGCHRLMDPLGFAFEHYDGIGKYRTMDNGGIVDATGELQLDGKIQRFSDAVELSRLLSQSDEVRTCFARQVLRYALRRGEVSGDEASITRARAAFSASDYDIKQLLVAIPSSDSFRYRTPAAGEHTESEVAP